MKNKILLTKNTFEKIITELVYLEEEKHNLTAFYFDDISEKDKCSQLIENYIVHLDELIKNTCVSTSANNLIPFVIIGSEVVIQDLDSSEIINLRITLPMQNTDKHCASFLSSIGMCLLLKSVGDIITVSASRYLIMSIRL